MYAQIDESWSVPAMHPQWRLGTARCNTALHAGSCLSVLRSKFRLCQSNCALGEAREISFFFGVLDRLRRRPLDSSAASPLPISEKTPSRRILSSGEEAKESSKAAPKNPEWDSSEKSPFPTSTSTSPVPPEDGAERSPPLPRPSSHLSESGVSALRSGEEQPDGDCSAAETSQRNSGSGLQQRKAEKGDGAASLAESPLSVLPSVQTLQALPAPPLISFIHRSARPVSVRLGLRGSRRRREGIPLWERQALLAVSTLGGRKGPSGVQTAWELAAAESSASAEESQRVKKALGLFCGGKEKRDKVEEALGEALPSDCPTADSFASLKSLAAQVRLRAVCESDSRRTASVRRRSASASCKTEESEVPPSSIAALARRLRRRGTAALAAGGSRRSGCPSEEPASLPSREVLQQVGAVLGGVSAEDVGSGKGDGRRLVLSAAFRELESRVFGKAGAASLSKEAASERGEEEAACWQGRPSPPRPGRPSSVLSAVETPFSIQEAFSHLAWIGWAARKQGLNLSAELGALRRRLRGLQTEPLAAALLPRAVTTPCLAALREWLSLQSAKKAAPSGASSSDTQRPCQDAEGALLEIIFRAAEASPRLESFGVAAPHLAVFANFLKEEAASLRAERGLLQEAEVSSSSPAAKAPRKLRQATQEVSGVKEEALAEPAKSAESLLKDLAGRAEEERLKQLERLQRSMKLEKTFVLQDAADADALASAKAPSAAEALSVASATQKLRDRLTLVKAAKTAATRTEDADAPLLAEELTVRNLARQLAVPEKRLQELASALLEEGADSAAGRTGLSAETLLTEEEAEFLSEELGCFSRLRLASRVGGAFRVPAVMAVLGHVDHGKTSLLDALRKTSVAKSEAGGITQRVSGGPLELPSVRLTCIDTPGHAAFFSMRERGASATDIVLLVVSAEEGVRPQTEECVRLLKQKKTDSGLKVVVAATKMDKPGASFERVKKELAALGIVSDEDGGDVPFVAVSAKTGEGLEDLEAALSLQQESLPHLWTPPPPSSTSAAAAPPARAFVLEAKTDPRRGRCLQVVVRSGWLTEGAWVCVGNRAAKLKRIWRADALGAPSTQVKVAGPSEVVFVSGLGELGAANVVGQLLVQTKNHQRALKLAAMAHRAVEEASSNNSDLAGPNAFPEVPLVLKAVDQGSLEALLDWIETHNDGLRRKQPLPERIQELWTDPGEEASELSGGGQGAGGVVSESRSSGGATIQKSLKNWHPLRVVRAGVGPVNATDARQAQMSNGIVLAFAVQALDGVKEALLESKHPIREQEVIYRVFEDLEGISNFHFGPQFEFVQVGRSLITQVGSYSLKNSRSPETVVGLEVKEGFHSSQHKFTLVREGALVIEQLTVKSMQKSKENVGSLPKGSRDGAVIFDSAFVDFKKGDVILSLERRERLPPPFIQGLHFLQRAK